jgi:hypothetical protein
MPRARRRPWSGITLVRLAVLIAAGALAVLFATQWDRWVGLAVRQVTDDAYVRGDIIAAGLLPWTGAAIGQFGGRAVLIGGVLLIGVGAVGVSQATAPGRLYAWNLSVGCGWAAASIAAISTILAQYFDQRRGQALSLALTGGSVGRPVVAPSLVALSHRYDFQMAVPVLALGLILMILPLVWAGIRSTGRYGQMALQDTGVALPGLYARRTALRNAGFWSVSGPFALAMFAMFGALVYQASYLLPLIGVGGTSVALICINISGAGGRLLMSAVMAARAFYYSDAYQAVLPFRLNASTGNGFGCLLTGVQ